MVRWDILCCGDHFASGGGNTQEDVSVSRIKQDRAIRAPCSALGIQRTASLKSIRECLRQSAADVETLELAGCEERNRLAVRRPERPRGAFGARQRLRFR